MSKIKSTNPSISELLDRVTLTEVERVRVEAERLRAEFMVELVIRGFSAVRNAVRSIKLGLKAKTPSNLGPTA